MEHLNKKRCFLGLILISSLAGCATGVRGTDNEVTSKTVSPLPGFGVAFGRICEGNGLWFRSKDRKDKEYLHIGGKTAFAIQLPEGTYQLVSVGSPIGNMVTDAPLEFTVTAGTINYVGSLMPQWNGGRERFPGACKSEELKVIKSFNWSNKGTFGTGMPIWNMLVANDLEKAVADAKISYPSLDTSNIKISLMH